MRQTLGSAASKGLASPCIVEQRDDAVVSTTSSPGRVLLPVNVARKIAKKGEPRPDPRTVAKKHPAWPGTWPPKDGWYSVATTWREILDAARSVGQDPFFLRRRYRMLANRELMARTFPLMAYLHHDATATPVVLEPSPVYEPGAEASAKAALAYRLGMTMTEWVARNLIGRAAHEALRTRSAARWSGARLGDASRFSPRSLDRDLKYLAVVVGYGSEGTALPQPRQPS